MVLWCLRQLVGCRDDQLPTIVRDGTDFVVHKADVRPGHVFEHLIRAQRIEDSESGVEDDGDLSGGAPHQTDIARSLYSNRVDGTATGTSWAVLPDRASARVGIGTACTQVIEGWSWGI